VTTPTIHSRAAGRAPAQPTSRLPGPVRERRPALAALAVLLILGGALASGLIALRSGERADYLVLRSGVQAGERIGATDLGVARIAGTGASAIPATQRAQVVGRYARARLFSGTLLTPAMLSTGSLVPPGAAVVGLVLSPARRPAGGLDRGDIVSVYTVPKADDGGGEATRLLTAVEVVEVDDVRTEGGSSLAVSVLVPVADAQELTLRSSLDQLAVAKLSPGTSPLVAQGR
jgi:SAF domain